MMFPRLILAKNLLADDGVIFISIDDFEVANLRIVCDELFGRHNFYCCFVWKRRSGAMDSADNTSVDHEYVLCYAKNKARLTGIQRTYEGYANPDNDPRGPWKADNLSAGKAGGDVYYPIKDPNTGNEYLPPEGRYWPYNPKTMAAKITEGRIIFPTSASGRPMLKRFKNEARFDTVPVSTWIVAKPEERISNSILAPANTQATRELQELFGAKLFPHPKSTQLISSLASQCLTNDSDIVLDFFAGSATTAHAIMARAAETGCNARFILVQLPELCDINSEAAKMGFTNIADISKERIRLAGKMLLEREGNKDWNRDVGFRVLKIDTSNMSEVFYTPDTLAQEQLPTMSANIKSDRTTEDLLFQVLLDWGVDLSLPIESRQIAGYPVFIVDENALVACFETGIDEALVRELAKLHPLRAVFRDGGYASDSTKINVEQIFKLLSPETEVRSL
jgi:adenine-specific DNA-methyltransferase